MKRRIYKSLSVVVSKFINKLTHNPRTLAVRPYQKRCAEGPITARHVSFHIGNSEEIGYDGLPFGFSTVSFVTALWIRLNILFCKYFTYWIVGTTGTLSILMKHTVAGAKVREGKRDMSYFYLFLHKVHRRSLLCTIGERLLYLPSGDSWYWSFA